MTAAHRAHVNRIVAAFDVACRRTYARGQREHGGNLWETSPIDLLESAIDEAVDQVVYLLTLRDKMTTRRPER